jgi:acyl-CoA thioester hydrolase
MIEFDSSRRLSVIESIRAPFHDIDPAGVVWHGRYFKYFELARCTLLEELDYSYEGMLDSGYLWPVVDSKIRYISPIVLNQQVMVTASLVEWELRLVVDYKIRNLKGVVITKARTVQVPVDAQTHELQFGSPEVLIKNVERRIKALENN